MGSYDILGGSASDEYYVEETNVPTGWTVGIKDTNGDTTLNGGSDDAQKAGSGTPITVANQRSIPKTELSVEKTWVNDNATADAANRAKISLILQRSTDGETWVDTTVDMPTPTKTDDKWTYQYTNLPAQDSNGNQYHYKIREETLEGYTTSYGASNDLVAVNDGNTGTLYVTNTRGISLTIHKVWDDDADHNTGEITVEIHRATNLDAVPDDVKNNLILQCTFNGFCWC